MRSNTKPATSDTRPGEDEKEAGIEEFGTVVEKFLAGKFSLQLEAGQKVLATLAGDSGTNRIKVMNGDRVSVPGYRLTIWERQNPLTATSNPGSTAIATSCLHERTGT